MALCAAVRVPVLLVLVFRSFARDALLRLDFTLVIGISFGFAATIAATTEAHLSEQAGGAGSRKRTERIEPGTVPLCLREKASPFWIILLLVERDLEHPRTKLQRRDCHRLHCPMSAFGGIAGMALTPCNVRL
jgi:hypothetical protein